MDDGQLMGMMDDRENEDNIELGIEDYEDHKEDEFEECDSKDDD